MTTPDACDRAREALWPDPAAGPTPSDARAHYEACRACQRFFAVQARLGRRLAHLPRPVTPGHLEARVRGTLATARPGRRLHRVLGLGGGLGLAAAAALALAVGLQDGLPAHVRSLAVEVGRARVAVAAGDVRTVEQWLSRQLGHQLEVPAITNARIRGVRLVDLDGRPAAAVVYEMHGLPLTWFALPGTSRLDGETIGPGAEIRTYTSDGYEIAIWGEREGARAVAAPMPRDEVLAVATECRSKALMRPGLRLVPDRRSPARYPARPAG